MQSKKKIKDWKYVSTEFGNTIAIVLNNDRTIKLYRSSCYRGAESLFSIEDANTEIEARKMIDKVLDNSEIIAKLYVTDLDDLDSMIWDINEFMFEDNLSKDEAIEKTMEVYGIKR